MPYADASFLVSLYILDNNSARAKTEVASITTPLPFSDLHALEVRNAFELGVFRGHLTQANAASAWVDLQTDIRNGRLVLTTPKWPTAFRFARWLSRRQTAALGLRSIDILHVACAKTLQAREFFSFDTRQRALASAQGLLVRP